jgi:large conductance mechanosensitive channel
MSLLSDFKAFISKGDVADLAIAVVIGAAFGKIVASLVGDILLPPVGLLLQGIDFKTFKWIIQPAMGGKPEIAIAYGSFIQVCIEFLVLAIIVFIIVQILTKIRPKEKPAAVVESEELKVLKQIRDSLKK